MNRRHSVVAAPIALLSLISLFSFSTAALAQQSSTAHGPPADLGRKIQAEQDRIYREDYGFTPKQIAQYRKKDAAIKAACEAKTEALRKQVAKSPAPKKRELYTQIRALEKQMDKDRYNALLVVATPAQQVKIKAKLAQQGITL